MKARVRKVTMSNGCIKYYPEFRFIFWWFCLYNDLPAFKRLPYSLREKMFGEKGLRDLDLRMYCRDLAVAMEVASEVKSYLEDPTAGPKNKGQVLATVEKEEIVVYL